MEQKNNFEKIPKKIHYIWLGGKNKSKFSEACILSWKLNNPDFEIIEWNEKNLDIEKIAKENEFFAQCKKRKLWAFMADYLRIKILYENGGIYIDTDVQSVKPINELLTEDLIIGYEEGNVIGTGLIGATKNNQLMKRVLDFYNKDIMNSTLYTIPSIMKNVVDNMEKEETQFKIFPTEYFAPYFYKDIFNSNCITTNTYAIHWFDGSWTENKQVGIFLQTKHIKNPIKKSLTKIKKIMGYYKRKII